MTKMRSLTVVLASIVPLVFCHSVKAQCTLIIDGDPTVSRSGPNALTGTATIYPSTTIQGNWTVTLVAQNLFTPTGGSEVSMGENSTNFNWGPGTPPGTGSSQSVQEDNTLEPYGDGGYRTRLNTSGTCGGGNYSPGDKYTSSLSIARPAAPSYSNGTTLAYFNGQSASYTTANGSFANTTALTAGAANGGTGTYNWDLAQSGGAGTYASLPSCSSCTSNTITALHESDGCLSYNVTVTTDYSGFHSEPLYVFIDRPYYLAKPTGVSDTLGNYGTQGYQAYIYYVAWGLCTGQGVLASYSLNEQFSTETDVVTNNWPHDAGGLTLGRGSSLWGDHVAIAAGPACLPNHNTTCSPAPLNAGSSSTDVQNVLQAWRIGSAVSGNGIVVQRNSLDRYIDHALHAAIVSPSN